MVVMLRSNVVDMHAWRRRHARKVISAMQTMIEQDRKGVMRHRTAVPGHDTTQPRLPADAKVVAGAPRYQKFDAEKCLIEQDGGTIAGLADDPRRDAWPYPPCDTGDEPA